MKQTKFLWYLLVFAIVFATACKKDDDNSSSPTPTINESEVLVKYLESPNSPLGKDYVNSDMPSIMPASEVKTLNATGQVYIIDIRSDADFVLGHIENAVNVPFGDVLNHIKNVDLSAYSKVAIVCYTGQTAGYVACILRLLGYDKVYSLKWGMCSWNDFFAAKWNDNMKNDYATQFTATDAPKGPMGSLPTLSTGISSGQEILEARIASLFADGFTPAAVTRTAVFGNLSNYYILNYWPENHYLDPGHIPGAIQYTPKQSIKYDVDLKTLPTDKTIAVYCYTGQNSANLAAYLRLLGYDAQSILYGTNGMIYDKMVNLGLPVFGPSQIMGYDYIHP
ncbi:rhodanese-like domain-containing protein [Bacteroidota bacterium]